MKRTPLFPCPTCARHVRVDDAACPFCASPLGEAFRRSTRSRAPATRLSRAALYALGVTVTACGGAEAPTAKDGGEGTDSALRDSSGGVTDTGITLDTGSYVDTGNYAVPYGVPVYDSGQSTDAGSSSDATSQPDIVISPPYGQPPGDE
jgi:hypothetical protein